MGERKRRKGVSAESDMYQALEKGKETEISDIHRGREAWEELLEDAEEKKLNVAYEDIEEDLNELTHGDARQYLEWRIQPDYIVDTVFSRFEEDEKFFDHQYGLPGEDKVVPLSGIGIVYFLYHTEENGEESTEPPLHTMDVFVSDKLSYVAINENKL